MRILEAGVALNTTILPAILNSTGGHINPNYNETKLPSLSGNPDTITVSGFSAGSFMAMQMHVIYSDTIKGAGLVGGGPFGVPLKTYDNNDFNTS